ncbi:MAG: TIGR03619 family F420-dependent LLM class oxidoreductase [SAR202 cluster bacterium]|jgi:probable F420-dependent oxidoreductase|nr:TIGR03619 family F420-dependent LLM class oxidoreductase [SAR202 cluster bacterium]MDP6513743.1 TIGR03619 family F420-dependent LLM class oxidoreductase [SAR202 cluster bacterium]MDP6714147.1 TIGR03619 family F420-dependent LLM class oxidoreductase [SAR202 cluster bacterium]
MEFGFGLPTRGPLATPENLAALAGKADELGFGFISVSDHVVIPNSIASTYPYSETGEFAGGDAGECLEQLTTLTFLAANSTNVRLLTSVMVLPHRPPVLTAKMLSTIDVLSNGRLILGCGVGWMQEEFEALGAEPFDQRGAVGDDYLRIFKDLWTSDDPSHDSDYASFSDVSFNPQPVQKPHPPIWVGGESPPALRRAATLGDTWYPIGANPRFPVGTLEQYGQYAARVRRYAEQAGRNPSEIGFAFSAGWYNDQEAATGSDGNRKPLTGTPQQIADDVKAYEELGVSDLMLGLQSPTLEETFTRLERFTENVKPLVG